MKMLPSARSLNFMKDSEKKQSTNQEKDEPKSKRVRTFENERNQFVIHIYYSLEDNDLVKDVYDEFGDTYPSVHFDYPPHISFLRGSYAVKYHQVDALMNTIISFIQSYQEFSVCLNDVTIFTNDEKTRSFVVLTEQQFQKSYSDDKEKCASKKFFFYLRDILHQYRSDICNNEQEKAESFKYHTSLAWFLPEHQDDGNNIRKQIDEHLKNDALFVKINQIHVRIGHKNKTVQLLEC